MQNGEGSSGISDHPCSIPSVDMILNPSPLPSIILTTLSSDVPSEKPIMLPLLLMYFWMDI